MSDDVRVVRVLKLLQYLQTARRSKSRAELARVFDISAKQVGRDLGILAHVGFEFRTETRGRQRFYKLIPIDPFVDEACPECRKRRRSSTSTEPRGIHRFHRVAS